jgi:hypothetical protein
LSKLQKAHAPASAVLALQMRTAREMLPLAERAQMDARVYLARSMELDPFVSSLARLVADHPDCFQFVMPVREAIDEAITAITTWESSVAQGYKSVQEKFGKMTHLGRIFQKSDAMFRVRYQSAIEGNEIVMRWDAELVNRE